MGATDTQSVYEELGVQHVVNARGNLTLLGGSALSARAQAAMENANDYFVNMEELMDKSGKIVANLIGAEAAYITSGCFAALALSAAAIMTQDDPAHIAMLPDTSGLKNEFLIQRRIRYKYDRSVTVAGGKLVEVGDKQGATLAQLEAAIGPQTAAILYLAHTDGSPGIVPLAEVIRMAHSHGVAVLVDAAAEIYPLERMLSLPASGADLVCFGAKYYGGNNSAGFLCGRRDLVETAARHGFIAFEADENRAFGRGFKVDRHEVIATVIGLQEWLSIDHEERLRIEEERIEIVTRGLAGVPNIRCSTFTDRHMQLRITLDEAVMGKTAQAIWQELKEGSPPVWVRAEDNNLFVVVYTLRQDEEQVVAERLRAALSH